ncbi:MAG: NifU family protein [Calothrix sp. MO_167.B42]|nr:NifU family protein [Calothrix sp. MO_167.B42]
MTNLEELVQNIEHLETIIAQWDGKQRDVVSELQMAIKSLHSHAFTHFIENIKPESISSLLHRDVDTMVYKLLLDKKIIEAPKEPLIQRLQQVLDQIRPYIKKYNKNLELVAFKPPDTLEISLGDNANHDTSVNLNLLAKIKTSIQYYCPEIIKITTVK